jgi:hypothetical protein
VYVVIVCGLHDNKSIAITRKNIIKVGVCFGRHEKNFGGMDILGPVVVRRIASMYLSDSEGIVSSIHVDSPLLDSVYWAGL